jgi:succinyl-CoA synthetase beta subunit
MARKIITEFSAKKLVFPYLGINFKGICFEVGVDGKKKILSLDPKKSYVIKVDQGIKKRGKKGLIVLDVKRSAILSKISQLKNKGFRKFIIEEFIPHNKNSEKYLSIERERDGYLILFSECGGIDIEENEKEVKRFLLPYENLSLISSLSQLAKIPEDLFKKILSAFDELHFSFLESNPYLSFNSFPFLPLDLAVEVDSAGEFFVNPKWQKRDFVDDFSTKTPEEKNVIKLQEKSPASFKLTVLNPNGSIFMLLSGGGASLVLADEVYNLGFGKELANYGEYSGNPTEEETYCYTKNLLSLLLKSKSKKKILIIGGGVANFTDVRITFSGIVRALKEEKEKLKKQNLNVFVRRGGPHEKEGLALMKEFLEKEGFLGKVAGSELILTEIIREALK